MTLDEIKTAHRRKVIYHDTFNRKHLLGYVSEVYRHSPAVFSIDLCVRGGCRVNLPVTIIDGKADNVHFVGPRKQDE